jgi:enhancer of polycomb-like protein
MTVEVLGDFKRVTRRIYDLSHASRGSLPVRKRLDIPVPLITPVSTYDAEVSAGDFVPPQYLRVVNPSIAAADMSVEYNLTEDDCLWLFNHAIYGRSGSRTVAISRYLRDVKRGTVERDVSFNQLWEGENGALGDSGDGVPRSSTNSNGAANGGDVSNDLQLIPEAMRHLYTTADDGLIDNGDANSQSDAAGANVAASMGSGELASGDVVPLWCPECEDLPSVSLANLNDPNGGETVIKIFTLTPSVLERSLDMLEKLTGFGYPVSVAKFCSVFVNHFNSNANGAYQLHDSDSSVKSMTTEVHNYWIGLRNKINMPLLRRFCGVVSANDTNPHSVFRAREKEKYKLRRSRKNDVEGFRKMMVLRMDFRRIRQLVKLCVKREEIALMKSMVEGDLFRQRLSDFVDTSGNGRVLDVMGEGISKEAVDKLTKLPAEEWTLGGLSASSSSLSSGAMSLVNGINGNKKRKKIEENGEELVETKEEVPLFNEFLPSREKVFLTSLDDGLHSSGGGLVVGGCYVSSYIDDPRSITESDRFLFKHRGRIGRGGRILIDRVNVGSNHVDDIIHVKKHTATSAQQSYQGGLLDFSIPSYNNPMVRENVNEIAQAWSDDEEEVLVDEEEWLEDGGMKWGKERFVFGPI